MTEQLSPSRKYMLYGETEFRDILSAYGVDLNNIPQVTNKNRNERIYVPRLLELHPLRVEELLTKAIKG